MAHLRTQLRDAVVAAVTGLASTAGRVHAARMYPQDATDLPCWLVRVDGEEVDAGSLGSLLERELTVVLSGYAKNTSDVDAVLNQLALEAEQAVFAAGLLGGKAVLVALKGIESGIDDSTEKPVGRIDLTYQIKYFTASGNPGVAA